MKDIHRKLIITLHPKNLLNPFTYMFATSYKSNFLQLFKIRSVTFYNQTYEQSQLIDSLSTFISYFEVSTSITCNRGTEFKFQLLIEFCKLYKIHLHFAIVTPRKHESPSNRK